MTTATLPADATAVRAALAAEWLARDPKTPEDILNFYRYAEGLEDDLRVFHADLARQKWTQGLVYVLGEVRQQIADPLCIDIGCGAGHDIIALDEAGARVIGVEPNIRLCETLVRQGYDVRPSIDDVDLSSADLLSCFDVLEHVPDPEAFLGKIAGEAKLGAVLVETCATFDTGTPLHLPQNRGWRTGRCMEQHGWEKVGDDGRLRAWQRRALTNRLSTAIMPVSFRSVSVPTHRAVIQLLASDAVANKLGWREFGANEAGLLRARNIAASKWWMETADDVFLMVDDDLAFQPEEAVRIVTLCREGHDVIAAAYPVRDGSNLAIRAVSQEPMTFGEGQEPFEVRYASTGFLAVHRRVLDAMIPTLPLCFAAQPWAYWPMFSFKIIPDEHAGGFNELSEDWGFCEKARECGFKIWIDPQIKLDHYGLVPISIRNMTQIKEAIDAH